MTNKPLAHVDGPALREKENITYIGEIPARGARDRGDDAALIFAERQRTTSYSQLESQASAFAHYLTQQGYRPGQRIAYLGLNNDDFFSVLFGCIRAGVVLVPLNWRLTAPELAYQLADSESQLLIHDVALAEVARAAAADLTGMAFVNVEGGDEDLYRVLRTDAPSYSSPRDPEQVILQMYTSGTTGKPKGTLISHYGLSIARQSELESVDMAHFLMHSRVLSAMPNFHIGGMSWVLMGLIREGVVVISADPSPGNMLKLLRDYQCKHSFIVPTVLRAMVNELEDTGSEPPTMEGIYYGAMPVGESLLDKVRSLLNCPLLQFFGMTENSGSATMLGPDDHDPNRPQLLKSVGKPYPGMSLEIRGEDGTLLRPGESGEIWVKSPTQMAGYWKLPEATAKAVVDGWYATGDGGYLDEEGFLYLTDRIKDMIVSGGENIYPAEVEEVLRQYEGVLDAAVVGIKDDTWGEKVVALVETKAGATLQVDSILSHCGARLARYKGPKEIKFGALPRTASGKVQRAIVRERFLNY